MARRCNEALRALQGCLTAGVVKHHGAWPAHRVFLNMHFITARVEGKRGSVFQCISITYQQSWSINSRACWPGRSCQRSAPTQRMDVGTFLCTQPVCREKSPSGGCLSPSVFPQRTSSFLSLSVTKSLTSSSVISRTASPRTLQHTPASLAQPSCISSAAAKILLS